jgi:hypothetical protein
MVDLPEYNYHLHAGSADHVFVSNINKAYNKDKLSGGFPHQNSVRIPGLRHPPHFHEIVYWLLYLYL